MRVHYPSLVEIKGASIVAICDLSEPRRNGGRKIHDWETLRRPRGEARLDSYDVSVWRIQGDLPAVGGHNWGREL